MTDAGDRPDQGAGAGRQWDVALSFAGAQRDYVGQVAVALKARGVRCFYDEDEQVRLWGTHLTEELPRIYSQESAAVVVFISAEYAGPGWGRLERRAALARAVAEAGVYVLPARFDDSPLPGLLPDIVTVDLRRYTPEQFAGLVAEKVAGLAGGPRAGTGAAAAGRLLAEVTDPFALEVHRPVRPEDAPPGLPELPAYMPREHDQLLAEVVRAAAGGRSGIAVLVGGSSVGKTRACWEALGLLRDQQPGWRVWHPIDPSRPDAALAELPRIGPRTVVWLNEAQFYLQAADGGLGERVAAGLRELLRDPARAPVLVLATLWPGFWNTLTARPEDGGVDPHAQARELLAGHDIAVPAAFTPAELGELAGSGDARLALAARLAADGAVIQFLAGAPELLARYRHAPPAAAALISAAMDARRLGTGAGLPRAFLEAAAPGYLTAGQWDALGEGWLEQALIYAAVPAKGARGPLTRIRPQDSGEQLAGGLDGSPGGPLYQLADYLDQHGRQHRKGQFPPPEFWSAAAEHAPPADQTALGNAADVRGLYRGAAQLHKNAAASGHLGAALYLSHPPGCLRTDPRPAHWAATYLSLDDPGGVAVLLDRLREAGADEQAAALLARDPAAHVSLDDPGGVAFLLDGLREAGADEQAAALLARDPAARVSLDHSGGVTRLLDRLREAGADGQVTELAGRAAAHVSLDDPDGVAFWLDWLWRAGWVDRLLQAGSPDQAAVLLARDPAAHVFLDDPGGVARLLGGLREAGADEQAAALLARDPAAHVSLDDPDGVARLLGGLREAGADEQAAALASRAAAHAPLGNSADVVILLGGLREAGADEQAAALASRAAAHAPLGNSGRVVILLGGLREAGADEQAAALASRAAAHAPLGNPYTAAFLLDWLREAGSPDQAATLLARDPATHVSFDDPGGVALLLGELREAGADEQAAALLARDPATHASLDDPYGVARLLGGLREAGADEQTAALASRAAAHAPLDDPDGMAFLLGGLREAGADEQAAALASRAAAHAPLDNPHGVVPLLGGLREAGAYEQAAALASRLPGAGMFRLFLQQQGGQDRFRFGREADGRPTAPWGWDDLD
jgi:hypothetical protein